MEVKTNGNLSFWFADMGGVPDYRDPLPGDQHVDVCIVGAGFTGLWTAYYLKKADPNLRVVVVEREFAGFGASGRNGGFLQGGISWSREKYLSGSSRAGVIEMDRIMHESVEEIIRVTEAEGIDADVVRVDNLMVAATPAQWSRLKKKHRYSIDWQVPNERFELLGPDETKVRIRVKNALGSIASSGSARVQPAKLVRGLAAAVERLGVPIYEQTGVTLIESGRVTTSRGIVRAETIVRATEGFTAGISGLERLWLPLNSALIITEPLSDSTWDEIGWAGNELLGDNSHAYCYAQRTRKGRIAMGGRGVPYRFGSRIDQRGHTQHETIRKLHEILVRVLPQAQAARIDHAWCGVLGVPRDWCATVGLDWKTGIGWAGGYVGRGVSTSNLSGRTLCDLILRRDSRLVHLPWVNREVKQWEPEPLRWLGVHSMYQMYQFADRIEARGGTRTSWLASAANRLTGRA
ncbi:NAD(P)/FAD-dependent oxidoreductase [Microvirga brassicacearum]|uniref:FAD-dependent oxidoreductase n=1 Tax=Microvirga brassicacearum TaxID=2580413 RepID=A0A5N3PB60_9HYPH|nr:FAD-binding oxidoreductase [Microvirga brassicacearum]KAB0266865.1 FAD-dependent oxidoreductase [Microvirga brassicacearum]